MGQIICHHKGRYNLYSTISDGFMFVSSLSLEQLKQLTEEKNGRDGIIALEARLERAHRVGHSSLMGRKETLDDFLCCNRAGENEAFLTTDQIIKEFLS